MESRFSLEAQPEESGKRLDVFLSEKYPFLSRSRIKNLIQTGYVKVDGKNPKAGMRIREGHGISLILPPPQKLEALPEPIPLSIVYEDSHLIIVDKPAGMVVHPAAGNYSGTLVNALLHHCPDLAGIGGVIRPGIVHRLDKDTSGILVVAKTDFTHRALSEQFKKHSPSRKYIGIVCGQIQHEGTIEASLGRDPAHRQKMSTRPRKGRPARTQWKAIKLFQHFTLAEFHLETGRTHQIRVHLASIGHPLLGDPLYGGRKKLAAIESPFLKKELQKFRRQALHAMSLGFIHPVSGKTMEFVSLIPDDLKEIIAILEKFDQAKK